MAEVVENARIIIVDDNPKNLQLLGSLLKKNGYQIGVAQNGKQALKAIAAVRPDLILLDIMMPEMDGYEVCRRLKESPETGDIPVIFLTARMESEDIVKGFEVGGVDYVIKPFNFHELLSRIKTHLQLQFNKRLILKQKNELNEMVHILCHDLSNPLQALNAFLQRAKMRPETLDIDQLRTLTLHSVDLIKLVRQLKSIEEGRTELNLVTLELDKMLEQALEIMSFYLSSKSIEIELDVPVNLLVRAERYSLVNTVFNNILSNAIKFSYHGSKIYISALKVDDFVEISFIDRGVGIDEAILERLFTVDRATSRLGTEGEKGTGFGMALVKKFITAYGGRLEISSKDESNSPEEHGTTIKLYLVGAL